MRTLIEGQSASGVNIFYEKVLYKHYLYNKFCLPGKRSPPGRPVVGYERNSGGSVLHRSSGRKTLPPPGACSSRRLNCSELCRFPFFLFEHLPQSEEFSLAEMVLRPGEDVPFFRGE